jgi:cytochrome c556
MIRTLSVIAAIGLAAAVATAQQNPIADRKQLMRDNGDQAKIVAAMAKGDALFDLAKAQMDFCNL